MDHDRFDGARSLSRATASRRDFGRALAGGGLGALFGSAFGALDADAKKKRDKKKGKKPQFTTVTRTVRQLVTQTFASSMPITIPNGAPGQINLPASPYPAAITVSGFTNGAITDINLLLIDLTSSYASDVQILLSRDDGRRALVMSDIGEGLSVTDIDLTLDDEAAAPLSRTALSSGTFAHRLRRGNGDVPRPRSSPQWHRCPQHVRRDGSERDLAVVGDDQRWRPRRPRRLGAADHGQRRRPAARASES